MKKITRIFIGVAFLFTSCDTEKIITETRQYGDSCDEFNQCIAGLYCESGICRTLCHDNKDCNHRQSCQNGRCVTNPNNECNYGWKGNSCEECASGFFGKECTPCPDCGEHGKCKDGLIGNGTCQCDNGWEGDTCQAKIECPPGFGGDNCDKCLIGYYGQNCKPCTCKHGECNDSLIGDGFCREESCEQGFKGKNCDQCADDRFTGPDCDQCTDTRFVGPNCDQCADSRFTGPNCDQCADDRFTGPNCDQCAENTYSKDCLKYGHMSDDAGNTYKTVVINGQTWMAENLRYPKGRFYHVGDSLNNDSTFGLLYNWKTAQTVCPAGWHLPTSEDFENLLSYAKQNTSTVSYFFSLISKTSAWKNYSNQGVDEFGFGGLPAGKYDNEEYIDKYFKGLGEYGSWWSSSSEDDFNADYFYIGAGQASINDNNKENGVSVRCINYFNCADNRFTGPNCDQCADSRFTGPNCDQCAEGTYGQDCKKYGSVTDKAGNVYKTVVINGRTWMAENIRYETYGSYHVNNSADNDSTYGLLYDWKAAQNVCPGGWHLPTETEYRDLLEYVEKKLTSTSSFFALMAKTDAWQDYPNKGGDDFGFGGLPAGEYNYGQYNNFGYSTSWWTSTNSDSSNYYYLNMAKGVAQVKSYDNSHKISVRCLRDYECSDDLYTGPDCNECADKRFTGKYCHECVEEGTYGKECTKYGTMKDIVGNTYRTAMIGNQTWMVDNMRNPTGTYTSVKNSSSNDATYGLLYNLETALDLCPYGWRLPTKTDFETLLQYVDENRISPNSFMSLIAKSPLWKDYPNKGWDEFGFNGLPVGVYDMEEYMEYGYSGSWWSSTVADYHSYNIFELWYDETKLNTCYTGDYTMLSVRCVALEKCTDDRFIGPNCDMCAVDTYGKDCKKYGTMNDGNGNVYKTVEIGNQVWMAENMRNPIGQYDLPDADHDPIYGLYYDLATAKNICPNGWHLPSKAEFDELLQYVHTNKISNSDFGAMIIGAPDWDSDDRSIAGDDFGFGALPGGEYYKNNFSDLDCAGYWWSNDKDGNGNPYVLFIGVGRAEIIDYSNDTEMPVRCLKNK